MQVKGLILHARKDFVIDHFGEDAWKKVVDYLPPFDQEVLVDTIITAKWYPFVIGERLDNAIVDVLGDGDSKIFEDIGKKSAQRGLTNLLDQIQQSYCSATIGPDPHPFTGSCLW